MILLGAPIDTTPIQNDPKWVIWLLGGGGVTGILVILGAIFGTLSKIIGFFKTFFGLFKKSSKKSKSISFEKHYIFDKIDNVLELNNITNSTSIRGKISTLLKEIKLNTYKKEILIFLKNDFDILCKDDIIKLSKNVLTDYSKKSSELFIKESLNQEEMKTAQLIIDKFNEIELRQITSIIETINHKKYEEISNNELVSIILSFFAYLVTDLVDNAKDTMNRINGQLTGLIFKGEKIEPHTDKI
jgi:hypothetical protein